MGEGPGLQLHSHAKPLISHNPQIKERHTNGRRNYDGGMHESRAGMLVHLARFRVLVQRMLQQLHAQTRSAPHAYNKST